MKFIWASLTITFLCSCGNYWDMIGCREMCRGEVESYSSPSHSGNYFGSESERSGDCICVKQKHE